MQFVPRPPSSVPLGGSLRASRAAWLVRPEGPLAAVDLADGSALLVHLVGGDWLPVAGDGEAGRATSVPAAPQPALGGLARPPPPRRKRLGLALAFAAALGAAVVGLATGFTPAPSPAAARATARPRAAPAPGVAAHRGGRALAPATRHRVRRSPAPAPPTAPAVPAHGAGRSAGATVAAVARAPSAAGASGRARPVTPRRMRDWPG